MGNVPMKISNTNTESVPEMKSSELCEKSSSASPPHKLYRVCKLATAWMAITGMDQKMSKNDIDTAMHNLRPINRVGSYIKFSQYTSPGGGAIDTSVDRNASGFVDD